MAVLVINAALMTQTINVSLVDLNISAASASARDIFAHSDLPDVDGEFSVSVAPHDSSMLLLKPLA